MLIDLPASVFSSNTQHRTSLSLYRRQFSLSGTFDQEECLSKLILFGEKSLQGVVSNYLKHYHHERNHQGKDHLLLFPVAVAEASSRRAIGCRVRLGGLLKYYNRAA